MPPGPIYEDPNANVTRTTREIQSPTELKGPVYEYIRPDPNTQSNVAYGHVQL